MCTCNVVNNMETFKNALLIVRGTDLAATGNSIYILHPVSSGPASSRMHTVSPGSGAAWVRATYLGLGPRWPPGWAHGWLGWSGWSGGRAGLSLGRAAGAGGAGVDVAALRLRDVGPAPGPQLRAAPARGRARGPRGPARGRGGRRRGSWRLGAGPGVAASGLLAGAPAAARRTPSVGAQLRPAPALRAALRPGAPLRGRGSCGGRDS